MNFFLEKAKPPEKVKYKLTEKTKLDEIERTPKEDKRIRELQVGIVINLNVARSIKNWLEQKIEEMESVIAETKKGR